MIVRWHRWCVRTCVMHFIFFNKLVFIFLQTSRTDTTCTEDSETWNILRDDYMMGAKMKDWDKADSDDEPSKSMDTRVSDSR